MSEEDKKFIISYTLYILRWICSTPIIALVLYLLNLNVIIETIIANLIGGMIFYWVDKKILVREKDER
jgi:putative flippase GtrA